MEAIQGYNYNPPYNPYQYQQPNPYYNPYQYQQQQKPQPTASAVTINIIEPKAYAGGEAPRYVMPTYTYPQASVYDQPGMYYPQQLIPQGPPQFPPQVPPQGQQQLPPYPDQGNQSQIFNQPPYIPQQVPPQMPQQVPPQDLQVPPQIPPIQQPPYIPQQVPPQIPQQVPPQPPVQQVPPQPEQPQLSVNDLPAINAALANGDAAIKDKAIEAIAMIGQGDANTYNALINELNADTSKMSGEAKAAAEATKMHSMWTLGVLNKNQNPQVPLVDLPGSDEVFKVLKADPNPEMRRAAISTLDFLSKPEDAPFLSKLYNIVIKKDKNPDVVNTAKNALAALDQKQQKAV